MFPQRRSTRAGAVIVWCSLLMLTLVGMVGLVIDGSMLMAAHRNNNNVADAAATAAAMAGMRGMVGDIQSTGMAYITDATTYNGVTVMSGGQTAINHPPASGPYTGNANYVEAIVHTQPDTFFIDVVSGPGQSIARAVAGFEIVAAGEGVIALDPTARPGLKLAGSGNLCVTGDVIVNSQGGGVDEDGNGVSGQGFGTQVTTGNQVKADNVWASGGVNDEAGFYDPVEQDNPLDADMGGEFPDPLLYLATPTTSNGITPVFRGNPKSTNGGIQLNLGTTVPADLLAANILPDDGAVWNQNYIDDPDGTPNSGDETLVLYPGIYEEIEISNGRVRFVGGIYVLRPNSQGSTPWTLQLTGQNITVTQDAGVMFYNTGSDFNPSSGAPDIDDGKKDPNDGVDDPPNSTKFGGIKVNSSLTLCPIDSANESYPDSPPELDMLGYFDGMLFYYRRQNDSPMEIEGDADEGNLKGTFYAKWSNLKITGQGTYNAQFITGSVDIAGTGDVTINFDGNNVGKAPQIFLVE